MDKNTMIGRNYCGWLTLTHGSVIDTDSYLS